MSHASDQVTTVTVEGQRLRVAIRRAVGHGTPAGTGVPLVACNGIGTALEALAPFTGALDPAIEVVRFDVPGVGGSPTPRLPYRLSWLAKLVARMMSQLGYDRFDVLGISWGGALAQQLAMQYPRRCRRLVLASTATGSLMVPGRPRVLLHLSSPRRHRDPEHAMSIAGDIYGGTLRHRPELAEQIARAHRAPVSDLGYFYQLAAGAGWTSLPWLPLVRQPALILAGDDDPIIPLVNARVMAALLPHARLHVFPDGHLGLLTRAGELAAMVSEFLLEGQPGAGPAAPRGCSPVRHAVQWAAWPHQRR